MTITVPLWSLLAAASVLVLLVSAKLEPEPSGILDLRSGLRTVLLAILLASGWAGYAIARITGAVALALLLAAPSFAQEPAPAVRWSMYSGTESLIRRGEDRQLIVFARVQALLPLPGRASAFLRVEGSAIGGGQTPDLSDPSTFSSLELYAGAYRPVLGPLSLAGLYGYTVPIEQGVAADVAYPQTLGAGVMVGDPRAGRWLLLTYGRHDAAGPGTRALFAGQWPIDGRVSAVADGALGEGGFVRAGVVVRVN